MQTNVSKYQKIVKKGGKDTVIPNVIDAQLIVQSVNQEQDKEYEGGIVNVQTVVLQNLKELSLSFKNIMEIQNLKSLEKLQKLQLDNNLISKIQNIDHLVNLKWLDLSFNNIEVIEGLENLVNLEDLSLYDNKISQLGGLDNCQKLNVFSIGNNRIRSYDVITNYFGYNKQNAQQLRFKHLQVLNVAGNPFTKSNESAHKDLIIAHLPGLKYLDYQFIDEFDRDRIRTEDDKITQDTFKQEEFFQQMQKDNQNEKEYQIELKKKKDARMDFIDNLHKEFIQLQDLDTIKPLKRDGIEGEIKKFSDKIVGIVKGMQEEIIKKNQVKQQDFAAFELAQQDRISDSEAETIKIIKEFEKIKKHTFREIEYQKKKLLDVDPPQDKMDEWLKQKTDIIVGFEEKLNVLLDMTEKLKDNLFAVEMQLDKELRESSQQFIRKILQFTEDYISNEITDKGQKKIEEAINDFNSKLSEIAKIEIDKYTQNPYVGEMDDLPDEEQERIELLENKESITQYITQIKESLQDKANEKMQSLDSRISQDIREYDEKRQLMLYERNRHNIGQIHNQTETYQEEIKQELKDTQSEYEND